MFSKGTYKDTPHNREFQEVLYNTLKQNGAMTRRMLVNELDKPRTTIYDNLRVMMREGVVRWFVRNNGKRGRPIVFFELILECVS